MRSFNVLDRKQPIAQGLFLEASAGTGKTFAIEHLVVRLLLEGKSPPVLSQILVITFTRAATRELKERIRANLEKARDALSNKQSRWDYLLAVIEQGDEAIFEAKRRLNQALVCFEEASIYTIHGFCHHVLQEHPFEAGVSFDVSDPDSKSYLPGLREVFFDTFRTELVLPAFSSSQVSHLLKRFRNDMDAFSRALMRIIEADRTILPSLTFSQLLEVLNQKSENLHKKWQPIAAGVMGDYLQVKKLYKEMTPAVFDEQISLLAQILEQGKANEAQFDELIKHAQSFLEKMCRENRKKKEMPLEGDKLCYPGLFEELRVEILPVLQESVSTALLLLRCADLAKTSWQEYVKKRDITLPDELLKQVDRALKEPHFRKIVEEKYRAVVIDEFQDTDPVQWSIVKQLDSPQVSLFLVGDPKQSIYAFRRADVYTYLEAAALFPKEKRYHLTTNFRSDPSLIKALNTLFSKAESLFPLPQTQTNVAYLPVDPAPGASDAIFDDGKGAVHLFYASGKEGRQRRWPTKELEEDYLFPFMAREIAALKMSRERLAILVKDRFQGARLERYLKGRHIEAEFSGASLEKRKEVLAALIEVMEGVVDYDDQATLKRALASTLIGFDEGKLQDQKTLSYAKGQALSLDHIWKQKGFGSWYQAFLQTSWEETGSSVIQLLEEETLLELESICEWVLELERVQHYVSHQLISALGELAKVEQEEDVFGPPLATDSKRVQIMTVHKSKGLEFDIVFALALASRHLSCEELVAIKDRGEEQIIPYDETNPLVQKATQERDAEKMRQLYVALTRAKKRIYLPILFEEEGKEPPAGAASPNELFFSKLTTKDPLVCLEELSKACSITYTKVEKEEKLILAQENQEPLVIRPPPLVELGSFSEPILSFSSVSKSEKSTTVVPRMATEEKSAHTLPPGALTGVIIHAIFEKIFSFGLFSPLQPDRIDALIQEEVQDTLLQNWEKTIFQMVDKALHLPLGLEPSFCLADLKSNAVLPEIEFLYPWEDGYLKGFIDLAFQKDGKVYLLDWKTNWLGDSKEAYTKQNLQKAMQEHDYFLQASIYTQALQRTLQGTHVRPFNEIFGGALYFFLRGPQVFLGSVKQ